MQKARVMEVLNDAFFRNRHEDERYRKGWCDAFMTVENSFSEAFREEIEAAYASAAPVDTKTLSSSTAIPVEHDPVNHPSYYCDGGIETLDFILAKGLNFLLGQVVKYVSRAGKKNPSTLLEDLRKAQFYLNREIRRLEANP